MEKKKMQTIESQQIEYLNYILNSSTTQPHPDIS